MKKSKATIANKSFLTILTIAILLISTLAFVTPLVSATIITIDPDSGPVGTEVRVIGTIDTPGGDYEIYWNVTLVKEGTCAAGSTAVNDTFTAPHSVNGSYTIKLTDPATGTTGTDIFIVETAYYIEAVVPSPPAQRQEGDTVTMWVNMTGGEEGVVYAANVTVADPTGAVYQNVTFLNVTTALYPDRPGYGESSTVYYTDFTTGAHTNYTGTYDIAFNETLATGSFFVGLTDKTEYARFEVVNIHVEGYTVETLPANVTVDIKFAGASVSGYPKNVSILPGGVADDNWTIPKDATLGTYTVTVTNATTPGTVKPIADVQDFEIVGLGVLSINIITQPIDKQRTETVLMEFNVTYPDGSLYNVTDFQSMNASLYYNTTFVKTIALTTANCNATTAIWNVTWKIPKDAKLGSGYNFTFLEGSIVDKEGNSGPKPAFSSTSFTVSKADLAVGTINLVSPAVTNRTLTASANFNITYPDGTYFTSTDLGWLNATIYANSTVITTTSLTSADYDSASKNWTVSWKIPWNTSLGTGYNFTVNIDAVEDTVTPTPNSGPTSAASSSAFEVKSAPITVTAVYTDKASYEREETMTVWFTATYPDGAPVTTGSANINITKADGPSILKPATYVTAHARFEATYYLAYDDPLGTWNATLFNGTLLDAASPDPNTGPSVTRFVTFEVVKVLAYVLDIDMDVGSIHFPLETAEFYALTSYGGVAVNASITATLYLPNGTTQSLTAVWVDTGLYKISYAIPTDATDTYTLVVNASCIMEAITVKGIELKCFLVSPTLTGWDARLISIDAGVATIQTDVGIIKMNLTDINAKIVSVQGDVALIETNIGTIKTDVAYIKPIIETVNATVTSIQGDVAIIKTDVGTLGV
ncbi:MAG: hypothetical protein U9O89_07005, partial [Thermoproteota archaeon]|nr:hypothetical protein [Thermoproteota archaeon]